MNVKWGGVPATWGGDPVVWPDVADHTYTIPPRSLSEILAGSGPRLAEVVIVGGLPDSLNDDGDLVPHPLIGTRLPVTAGNLDIGFDRAVRLAATLEVPPLPEFTRVDHEALLHPANGLELLVRCGALLDDGSEYWWPYGVVRPFQPGISWGDGSTVTVECQDLGGVLKHAGAPRSWVIRQGENILASIAAAVSEMLPSAKIGLPMDQDIAAAQDIELAEQGGDDLWEKARTCVRTTLGRNLHFDANGVLVAPETVVSGDLAPVDVPLVAWESAVDYDSVVHRVSARWEEPRPNDAGEDWVGERGEVIVEDDALADLAPWLPRITKRYGGDETMLGSANAARSAAATSLANFRDTALSGSCQTISHPDVMPGQVLTDFAQPEFKFRITQVRVDLAGGATQVALGARYRTSLAARIASASESPKVTERDEVVTSTSPLMSRLASDPQGAERMVDPTDAMQGVAVGDPIRVRADGAGRRVATALLTPKTVVEKHSGDDVGTVNGKTLEVGGSVTLDSSDVGAAASGHTHTPASIGAATASHTHADYASTSHTHSGYASTSHTHTAAAVGAPSVSNFTVDAEGRARISASNGLAVSNLATTTASGEHLTHVLSGGGIPVIYRITSLRAAKADINTWDGDPERLLDVPVRTWTDRAQLERHRESPDDVPHPGRQIGLVAEEVIDAGLDEFITRSEDGTATGVDYSRAWLPLLGLVRDLRERVAALELRERS